MSCFFLFQSSQWTGVALQLSLATTYVFTMNLRCSACIFHSEQYMVQDFCQLSITILFSYECPDALDGVCVLNGHYCNWSLYNCTKTQAVKSLANQGWIQVSYQQLGSQAIFDFLKSHGKVLMTSAARAKWLQCGVTWPWTCSEMSLWSSFLVRDGSVAPEQDSNHFI